MRTGAVRRGAFLLSLAVSVACIALSCVVIRLGAAAAVVVLPAVLLLFRARIRGGWPAHFFLAATVCVAAVAAVAGAPAALVVPGGTLALAAWDLAEHDRFLRRSTGEEREGKGHASSLARALALGLVAAGVGLALSVRIPFSVMLLLVILDLACLGYALRLLGR
jgi:hypothetical protein